jgi:excisionase family DNA binding protein
MTTTTLGDLLARADHLCRELRDNPDPVPLNAWESFDATAYLLMRELVGPARAGSRAVALSHAALCRVLDAYPAPLRGAATGPVGAREAAHLLGRPRSAVIAKIRQGHIPATWDGRQYLVDLTDLPNRHDVRPADPRSPEPLSRLSCTLGVAADLVAQNRGQLTRDVDAWALSPDSATAPVLARVVGIIHVAAAHAVRVGPLSDVDRPLAVARYSAKALDALGDVPRGSPLLATASFAPPSNPVSLNERLESGLRAWVAAAQVELNRTLPSTDVIRNVMNQGTHLYAVSARFFEAAQCAGEPGGNTAAGAREHLSTAMKELSKADRLWGSVTTAMRPSHEYVAAARELHAALTETTHDGLRALDVNEVTGRLDIGQALADLRYAARDVADMVRDVEHLPDQLLRSGVLFAPARNLTPSVERLHERTAGRYVSVLPNELPELAGTARSAAIQAALAARSLDHKFSQVFALTIAGTGVPLRNASVPEL